MKLLLLAKEPVPGRVKTRLVPPLTFPEAAEVAQAALADSLQAAVGCGADEVVVALDGAPGPWLPAGVRVVPQRGTAFADRLAAAWSDCGGPALQIGMDTPQVSSALLDRCLAALAQDLGSALLGRAADGGWWALGLSRPHERMFRGIPMSTPATGARQWCRLVELGLRPRPLPVLRDVDTWADALAVADQAPAGRFAARVAALRERCGGGAIPVGASLLPAAPAFAQPARVAMAR